jgi:hypothetical protein
VFRGWSADRAAEDAEEGRRLISLNPQLLTIARVGPKACSMLMKNRSMKDRGIDVQRYFC